MTSLKTNLLPTISDSQERGVEHPALSSSTSLVLQERPTSLPQARPRPSRTKAAKAEQRLSILKHGLTSKEPLLSWEDKGDYKKIAKQMDDYYRPMEGIEAQLLEHIVNLNWKLKRIHRLERDLMEEYVRKTIHPHQSDRVAMQDNQFPGATTGFLNSHNAEKNIDCLIRYQEATEKSLFRAIHEFRRLQDFRTGRAKAPTTMDVNVYK